MSVDGWNTVLVLGGIQSGSSEFAESLVVDQPTVRYVVTAARDGDADRPARIEAVRQRSAAWTIEQTDADPSRLAETISGAAEGETLLVDDLGGWVTTLLDPAHQPADDLATIGELATAIDRCSARLVLITPEAGLSPAPTLPVNRAFVDALGTTNRAVAQVCDAVALVVAGQPAWLKPGAIQAAARPAAGPGRAGVATDVPAAAPVEPAVSPDVLAPTALTPPPAPATAAVEATGPAVPAESTAAWTAPTTALPMVATGLVIQPGMELPMPDEEAGLVALDRLPTLDLAGAGLGNLRRVVGFGASTQGTAVPTPWRSVRVLLLHGDHEGGAAAGTVPGESARRADEARGCAGPLAGLAADIDASLQVVEAPMAAAIEHGPALSASAVESALRFGWRLAEEAADAGVDLIVLAACGAGTEAAAAAVLAATAGAEPAAVLARVVTPGGQLDDAAWMTRCAAVRDALHRTRHASRGAKDVLAELGGGDVAIATGVLLGATARRTPVLLDGPVGVAAGLISRDLAGQARHWCLLPDHGGHPAVRLAADVLGLTPMLDLNLDLGEGMTALATLPLLRSALALAATVPVHPTLVAGTGKSENGGPVEVPADDAAFIEPEPAGPGPAGPADAVTPDDVDEPDDVDIEQALPAAAEPPTSPKV